MINIRPKPIELTPEEQEKLPLENPRLWEAIQKHSAVAQGWLTCWRNTRNKVLAEVQNQIEKQQNQKNLPAKRNDPHWFGYPTPLTRCSPFFPINRCELNERLYLRDFVIMSANWGRVTVSGPQMSTYDEDVLLAVLALLDSKKYFKGSQVDDKGFIVYRGALLPILKMIGFNRPSKKIYDRVMESLKLMLSVVVTLSISDGYTKSGKPRTPKLIQITSLLSAAQWDKEKKELLVAVNPFFYESYVKGRITLLDITQRMTLRSPIAKSLYRFMQSHRNHIHKCSIETLIATLNLDAKQPLRKNRQLLKSAITALIEHGILEKGSGFVEQNIIQLNRAKAALPTKK